MQIAFKGGGASETNEKRGKAKFEFDSDESKA